MSQDNFDNILFRLNELEKKMKEYEQCKKEFDELKCKVEDIILLDFAPIHEHIRRWDNRDIYLFRTKMFLKKYLYKPFHLGIKTIFVIVGRLLITLFLGITTGILLNMIGFSSFVKNIINFFHHLFN